VFKRNERARENERACEREDKHVISHYELQVTPRLRGRGETPYACMCVRDRLRVQERKREHKRQIKLIKRQNFPVEANQFDKIKSNEE